MNTKLNAAKAGFHRSRVEFAASFRNAQELLFGYLFFPFIFVIMAVFFLDRDMEGVNVGAVHMTAGIALLIGMLGLLTVAQVITTEREDGTLLRARAVPHGLFGYAIGKTLHILSMSIVALALMVIPAQLFVDGFAIQGLFGLFTLVWVCLLGLLALAPFGAILGSLINNPRNGVGVAMLPLMLLIGISGIYFPLELMPGWLQAIAVVFPLYWVGDGLRAAILPPELSEGMFGAAQLPVAAGVLALWAVLGFLLAQRVLRRMAQRTSGSRVQAAREEAMKRAY